MRLDYREYHVLPIPGQPKGVLYRPVIPVQMIGPNGTATILGLLDTGSDVTILPAFLLPLIGVTATAGEPMHFRGVGGTLLARKTCPVELALDHPDGGCRWPASVVFLDGNNVTILGYSGFLEYFTATFNSERHWISLKLNGRFRGERP